MKTLRSLLSDIIDVLDILESLKAPKVEKMDRNYYVPKPLTPDEALAVLEIGNTNQSPPDEMGVTTTHAPAEGGPHLEVTEFAKTVAEALEKAQLGEVENVSGDGIIMHTYKAAPAEDAPVWEKARQAIAQGDPEENAHNAAMFVPEAEPEKKPRKPRAAKAPKPEPVDIGAVRQEVAEVISVMVTEGKKDVIKSILSTYGVDRARELPDDKVENFLNDLRTPLT
jgi:hypothetical protein